MKKWTMHLIHHTHTDIGYTDSQEKIIRYHTQFIKQAAAYCGKDPDFKWNLEGFFALERFIKRYGGDKRATAGFVKLVKDGKIDISANYLNMNELMDVSLFREMAARAKNFADGAGIQMKSAMIADVNGYCRSWARVLTDIGTENLLAFVHSHHGLQPAGKKQAFFWWDVGDGKKLLVLVGEHYNMGNSLCLAPKGGLFTYMTADGFNPQFDHPDALHISTVRVRRYLESLEKDGYEFDDVAMPLSGVITDNSPPGADIADFARRWNKKNADTGITLKMSTMTEFCGAIRAVLEKGEITIPEYGGEWTDWWSDGYLSTPEEVRIFRNAARMLGTAERLDKDKAKNKGKRDEIKDNLALFTEHTWGHSASVSEPYNQKSLDLLALKKGYAIEAFRKADIYLDDVLEGLGAADLYKGRPFRFKVINSFDSEYIGFARMFLDYWEMYRFDKGIEVLDGEGRPTPSQFVVSSRGRMVYIPVRLKPFEHKNYTIVPAKQIRAVTTDRQMHVSVGKHDIAAGDAGLRKFAPKDGLSITTSRLSNSLIRISWSAERGIYSWRDLEKGAELIDAGAPYMPFTPVYEITPASAPDFSHMRARGEMGRNRKGMNVERYAGRLRDVRVVNSGDLLMTVEFTYQVKGLKHYGALLTVYKGSKKVDVKIQIQKDCELNPENVYIPLPYVSGGEENALYTDVGGAAMRPWKDELYGATTDFYTMQTGAAVLSANGGTLMCSPDAPCLHVGDLEYRERVLGQDPLLETMRRQQYVWLMSNYWETNFKASTEGFFEFNFCVESFDGTVAEAFNRMKQNNEEAVVVRTA
ncbi:MAG: hypothetical protein LBL66_01565 [Clostridiales bacterium]|jgi:hypothetical protein|nr:hypothetical protein [Clostridiales bacterium]